MSFDPEQALLGAILLDNRQFHIAPVEVCDFTTEEHRKIYQAICELLSEGKPADVVSVGERVDEDPPRYLVELAENVPRPESAPDYARAVREHAERKRLVRVLKSTTTDLEARCPLEDAKDRLMEAVMDGSTHQEATPFSDAVADLESVVREMQEAKGGAAVLTGIETFDHEMGGFHGERVIVLGGRPGVHKTGFACQIAANGAKQDKAVLVISLETGGWEIAARVFAREFGIEYSALLRGQRDVVDKFKGSDLRKFREWPIWIDDRSKTLSEIRARLYEAKYRFNIQLGIVDHIQLVQTGGRNRFEELSEISRGVKAVAMDLKTPILVLSQLSREVEREKREPRLSDLRECGNVEQDADAVLLMHREKDPAGKDRFKLIIAKNRGGRAGCDIPLMVDPGRGLIGEERDWY